MWHETRSKGYIAHAVAKGLLENVSMWKHELHELADASIGVMKGLKMKRTINAFYRYCPQIIDISLDQEVYIDPDPSLRCSNEVKAYRIDIEDIALISKGCIIPDIKPDKQTFEVTGAGGSPVYAIGDAKDATFVHSSNFEEPVSSGGFYFKLDLLQIKRCPSKDLESVEIHINGIRGEQRGKCKVSAFARALGAPTVSLALKCLHLCTTKRPRYVLLRNCYNNTIRTK